MTIKETRQIVDMLDKEWDLGKKSSKPYKKTCAWIYWFDILAEAEHLIVKKENKKTIGVAGYTKYNSNKYLMRKRFYKTIGNILMHSPLIKNKKAYFKYRENYGYLTDEIKSKADGEVTILIVDKAYRGQKYGYELLTKTFELAKKDGLKSIQIVTDESCNFKFYEQLGCEKIHEQTVTNYENGKLGKASSEQAFIYQKELGDINEFNK